MIILLLIISHICVAVITGCAVSIFKDYKAGDNLVCKNIKQLKEGLHRMLGGIIATVFCIVISATFAIIWLLG